MKLSMKPAHLKRYKDILRLVWKYGRSDVARGFEDLDDVEEVRVERGDPKPEELADDLERMGPTFVKLGQLLSSRADLLPDAYLEPLSRLQDDVKPFDFAQVEGIVQEELGVRLSKAFSRFDATPLAAASLGQVHAAALRDGREVVVKVQRPDIKPRIVEDFEVITELATFADAHTEAGKRYRFGKIVDEMKTTLFQELDYEREASNLRTLAANLASFERIHVPSPIDDYSTARVLTMDFVRGTKITKLTPLKRIDVDGEALADELLRAYLQQVLVDGIFHADPHPGNIFLTDDGRIALLDLGMVGRTTDKTQEDLLRLTLALAEGNADAALEVTIKVSEAAPGFDEPEFRRRAGPYVVEQRDTALRKINVGRAMLGVARIGADTGLYAPPHLALLGKTLMQLDQIGTTLAPDFDPNAAVQRHASEILTRRMWKNFSPAGLLNPALELKDFVTGLPKRLNKILDAVGNAELELKVKAPDTEHMLKGFQKIANRITTGLILAALIVGASLLMPHSPKVAMPLLLIAAGGGLWLVVDVMVKDARDRRQARR